MRPREFITLFGGVAATWSLALRAQESERTRRIGVLMPGTADDAEYRARLAAFLHGLQQLGWSDGRNVRFDTRWAAGNANLFRKYSAELVALAPDVILAPGSTSLGPLLQATRTVPIVFTTILDPVGAGFVDSLARPGGCRACLGHPIYESQRRSRKARAYLQAYRLRQRLGGSRPVIDRIPPRPYRMKRRRYRKLVARIEVLERSLTGSRVLRHAPQFILPLAY
jgi:hypothetical protein